MQLFMSRDDKKKFLLTFSVNLSFRKRKKPHKDIWVHIIIHQAPIHNQLHCSSDRGWDNPLHVCIFWQRLVMTNMRSPTSQQPADSNLSVCMNKLHDSCHIFMHLLMDNVLNAQHGKLMAHHISNLENESNIWILPIVSYPKASFNFL